MGKVYDKRANADKYAVKKDDTLIKIAAKYPGRVADWKELARYNYGSDVHREVNRALYEQVGVKKANWTNAGSTTLEPPTGKNPTVLVPKLWKKAGYAQKQRHVVRVKPVPKPATAVKIVGLDKWFIPGTETCEIKYVCEGIKDRASKLDLEIHASNYCTAATTARGEFLDYTYTACADPLLVKALQADCPERKRDKFDWDGKSEAAHGALKPRSNTQPRYVNAAHSPYTVMLRYYKDTAGKNRKQAKLFLYEFWPQFDNAGAVVPASLKFKWKIEGAADLRAGMVVVYDGAGKSIYRCGLGQGDVTAAPHEFDWAAKGGAALVTKAKMPYRVQIQAHTDMDNDDGLGLAAMHAEVRLFVHRDTGTHPNAPVQDPQCLQFALAPLLPYRNKVADRPALGTDNWWRLQLAEAGFHPGPCGGDAVAQSFTDALREFQRSYPRTGAAPHSRLRANGAKNVLTRAALRVLAANARPLFGDPANRTDLAPAAAGTRLTDKAQDMIVWVNDRHYYTQGAWKYTAATFTGVASLISLRTRIIRRYDMENYRGPMSVGDGRVTRDRRSAARPWVPVEVTMALLAKTDPLEPNTAMPPVTDAMRQAIGPIRVDWTFEELPAEFTHVPVGTRRTIATCTVGGPSTGGTFRLQYNGWNTANIARMATAAQVQTALRALGAFPSAALKNRVTVTGPNGGPWVISFDPPFNPAVTTITGNATNLSGGPVTVAAAGNHSAATVTIQAGKTGGTFTLSFGGQTTGALARNAASGAIQTALRGLTSIAAPHKAKATVTGGAGGPWTVTFASGFPGPAASTITGNGASLTGGPGAGGTVTVAAAGPHSQATITLNAGNTGGTFTLTFGASTTGNLARTATGAQVQVALRALASIVNAHKPKVTVAGAASGPWTVTFTRGFPGAAASTITGTGTALSGGGTVAIAAQQQWVSRGRKFIQEILTQASPRGLATIQGGKTYSNCPEQISGTDAGGIRPANLAAYYRAPIGFRRTEALLPWLAYDDTTVHSICSFVHDDLGQAEAKLYPDFVGKTGVYLRPSRIAGDGYQYRAQVSFKRAPGTAGDHPNRQVLERRYAKLPQAHTAKLRVWRKTSFRAYVGWAPAVQAGWQATLDAVAAHYRQAHVHFVHEGPNPATHQSFPTTGANALVSANEFRQLVSRRLAGTSYHAVRNQARLTPGYIWPFVHRAHFQVRRRPGNARAFLRWLSLNLELDSWDRYSKELINLITAKIETLHGRMRGHVVGEFASSPPIRIIEYRCNVCGDLISDVGNHPAGPLNVNIGGTAIRYRERYRNTGCRVGACAGRYQVNAFRNVASGLPLCAIGQPLGGSWVFLPRDAETWTHEVGHHRHFEHAQAYAGQNQIAPGGKVLQHDSAAHPGFTATSLTAWQRAWDRFCIMSYDSGASQRFCGKCLLRNRGWGVERINNPNSALTD